MKNYFYIIQFLLLIACARSNEDIAIDDKLGSYKLISLISDVPLDLNYDGTTSTNFKEELNIYFFGNSSPRHDLELVKSDIPNEWFFRLGLPKDNYHPDQTIVELRFGTGDYSKSLLVVNNTSSIKYYYSDFFDADSIWLVENKYPYPYEVNFDIDAKVTVKISQKFYDKDIEEWIRTDLIGIYEKL